MFRRVTFILIAAFCFAVAFAAETFKQVSIFVPDKATLDRIWSTGIDHEGSEGKIGGMMEFVAGEFELQELARQGIGYSVVIDDLAAYYEQRLSGGPVNALGFGLGSMGGHYTLQEVIQQLDSMRLLYPNLITVRDSIGRSQQGRAIWIVKIGSSQSAGTPEALYTSLHHAREPAGMMSVVYYMWWLLENYTTDARATYLVNNRQQWFIPVVNPDGYEYNRSTNPNGGGMWRKNRRDNGGSFGVDLNRNYGPMYMWNASNGGSSTTPSSDTYRGPSPFSDPETQAIDNFMRSRNIKTCLNYHTYGSYLIYPWGYLSRENGDSLTYRDWAYFMTAHSRATNGTDQQTVNYSTRGNSDDYMFGDTTKPIAYAMTPEVGIETDGFWAPSARILPLAMAFHPTNMLLAYFAGQYTTVVRHEVQESNNGFLNRGENFSLAATVKNKGTGYGNMISVQATSSLPTVQFTSPVLINQIMPQQERQVILNGTVATNATEGVPVFFYVTITDGDGFLKIDTLQYFIGTPTVLFADSASNGTGNWNTGTGWGTTSNAHTPPFAFTDSPTGNYATNANNSLTLNNAINLAGYNHAQLKFWTKWAVEPTWDFATVEISSNNGTTWTTLRSELSHFGSARSGSKQPAGTWGYDSYTPGGTWVEQSADLSGYVNSQIKLRFRMSADGGDNRDGIYVDDIRVHGFTTIAPPPDTGIVVFPSAFAFNGPTGRVFRDSLKIKNLTAGQVSVNLIESGQTSTALSGGASQGAGFNLQSIIDKLRPAFQRANLTPSSFIGGGEPPSNPLAYTTILTDERGEVGPAAADIYRVQYQFRTGPLGSYHDFKVVMNDLPDTNIIIILSVDTDQDFGTGRFPTPLGLGLPSRDIGSEREILIDASGILIDSLTGFGRIRAGVVISTENDTLTIVGLPFLLSIQRDSVLTIGTETAISGITVSSLNDPDGKMNIGFLSSHIQPNANPLPDFAPQIGHANIGGETGVSWLTFKPASLVLESNDSAMVQVTSLAAKPAGTFNANIALQSPGRVSVDVPISMNVSTPPAAIIQVSPTIIRDTLVIGDSVTNTISVRNLGGGTLNFAVLDTSGASWLTISPQIGTADSGMTVAVSVNVKSAGLQIDSTYSVRLFVVSNDPNSTTVPVELTLRVKNVTSVGESDVIPVSFALHQNYPNPFNPETNISFDLPRNSFATLKIFNLIGQEVATIVDAQLAAGTHSYIVGKNQHKLSSGVYFYRLQAGEYTATKKLVLLK